MKPFALGVLLAITAFCTSQVPKPVEYPKVPLRFPVAMPPHSYISTSAVVNEKGHLDRIFRYSYKADPAKEEARITKILMRKGWKAEKSTAANVHILSLATRGAQIFDQSIVFNHIRLVADRSSNQWCRPVRERGWIWISYNETYSTRATKALLAKRR